MRNRAFLLASLTLLLGRPTVAQNVADPDPARFQSEIDAFSVWDAGNSPAKDAVLFVGSSSIRLWNTAEAFRDMSVVNRGFGGAHISDMLSFFDRIVTPYVPKALVFYCGDNDVADGKPVEQVVDDFGRFVQRVREALGPVPIVYIPIKPSIARWKLREPMRRVNDLIAQAAESDPALVVADVWTPMVATGTPPDASLFMQDGLHLSTKGYALWNRVVGEALGKSLD